MFTFVPSHDKDRIIESNGRKILSWDIDGWTAQRYYSHNNEKNRRKKLGFSGDEFMKVLLDPTAEAMMLTLLLFFYVLSVCVCLFCYCSDFKYFLLG